MPVYNTSALLGKSVDSVLEQTLHEIELICVNDGSTDDSLALLEGYAQADSRVKVISQENAGCGAARNTGFQAASGKYVVFWDSDDLFREDALALMSEKMEQEGSDVCICDANDFDTDTEEVLIQKYLFEKKLPEKLPFAPADVDEKIFGITPTVSWNKMYRTEFVREHGLTFGEGSNGEAIPFTFLSLCLAKLISVVPEKLVLYRVNRADSNMGMFDESAIVYLKGWALLRQRLIENDVMPQRAYDNRIVSAVHFALTQVSSYPAFVELHSYLHTGGLKELGFPESGKDADYYINPGRRATARHIRNDSVGELLMYLLSSARRSSATYKANGLKLAAKNESLKNKNTRLKAQVKELKERTFKARVKKLFGRQ